MSDLGTHAKLARPTAQLPVNVYFDEALLQREMQQLFKAGPRYVGHELMVPNVGDYATLPPKTKAACWCATPMAWSCCPTSAATARR
jgi:hypothetical protein